MRSFVLSFLSFSVLSLITFLSVFCLSNSVADFRTLLKYDQLNVSVFCINLNAVCPSVVF